MSGRETLLAAVASVVIVLLFGALGVMGLVAFVGYTGPAIVHPALPRSFELLRATSIYWGSLGLVATTGLGFVVAAIARDRAWARGALRKILTGTIAMGVIGGGAFMLLGRIPSSLRLVRMQELMLFFEPTMLAGTIALIAAGGGLRRRLLAHATKVGYSDPACLPPPSSSSASPALSRGWSSSRAICSVTRCFGPSRPKRPSPP